MRAVVFLFLAVSVSWAPSASALQEPGSSIPTPPAFGPGLYFRDAATGASIVLNALRQVEQYFPGAKRTIFEEAYRVPPPRYQAELKKTLFEERRTEGPDGPTVTAYVSFTKWADTLLKEARALEPLTDADAATLKPRFASLHQAYVRVLVTTYVVMECMKRAYLMGPGQPLAGADRGVLLQWVRYLHEEAQKLMTVLAGMRNYPPFAEAMPFHAASGQPIWENIYAQAFHYKLKILADAGQTFTVRDLAQYFQPFLSDDVISEQPGELRNDARVRSLISEYLELQRQIAQDPRKANDAAIQNRIYDLRAELLRHGVRLPPPSVVPPPGDPGVVENPRPGGTPGPMITEQPPVPRVNERPATPLVDERPLPLPPPRESDESPLQPPPATRRPLASWF